MDELRTLLQDAVKAQVQTLEAITNDPEQVYCLKDPVLLVLDVLSQCDTIESRRETLQVLRRVFQACSAHFYNTEAFLETYTDAARSDTIAKRGNVLLKALLRALTTLSSQDEVLDEETMQTLVDMMHKLCSQSMSTTDVVTLFDFLRLGRPPARRWVLQMQKALVEMDPLPRAIFTMRGSNAGLTVPSTHQLFTKKGYSCSFGIYLDVSASDAALYSFRGYTGQGVSAMLRENKLSVKMVSGHGVVQQVEVPFLDYVDKMKRQWVHMCIVHAKKMFFQDKVTVYVDGKSVFNGSLGYPDPLMMVGGQNGIGTEPLVDGLNGKLWSPTLFGVALSEAEVQRLHWQTQFKNDSNSVAAENAGLTDKFKLCFCYDARSCDLKERICYDVSGNDCDGSLRPGTSSFVTQSFVHALDCVGGCACFLLLLLDQIPEMADFHPVHKFETAEVSDLLAFVGAGLSHSNVCRSHFFRLQGVRVVEFVLQSISPSYLSISLLDGVISILEAMTDFLVSDENMMEYIYRLLFFNTSWFLSPFDTQVKLLGEVLPSYLQILQKMSLQERGGVSDMGSPLSNAGQLVVSRATLLSDSSSSLESKEQADVSFFCRLLTEVYVLRASSDEDEFTTGRMDPLQLAQLRELVLHKLVDLLLFPLVQHTGTAEQWRQLIAFLFQQCEIRTSKYSYDGDNADIEEILRYLTLNLASTEPRKGAVGLPTRHLQLTTNLFKLSMGTVRILWRPMLSANYNMRIAALRLFESYTFERVVLHKSDMLMLYSSFQAHTLTRDIADLLMDIVIGRKRLPQGNSTTSTEVRTGSFARMTFIPLVLLGLVHNANFDVQVLILAEIKIQLASPTMGDSIKEAIRSWPSWLSRLRALTREASVVAADLSSDIETIREKDPTESAKLNEACSVLSGNFVSTSAKLEALQMIADFRDVTGCDFALCLLQNCSEGEAVTTAITAMVIKYFPQRWCDLVRKLANQIIVDIILYCVLHVRNGWMHFLEFYFCHCRAPSDFCSLTAVICEQLVRQASQKHSTSQSEIVQENLCQVAAIVSQSSLVATTTAETLKINDVVLSQSQQSILTRNAFELWQLVLPYLNRINWDALVANLIQNVDYGSGALYKGTAIFTHLVATRSRSIFLALLTTIQHVVLAYTNNVHDMELTRKFCNVLELVRLVSSLQVTTSSRHSSGSISPLSGLLSSEMLSSLASGSILPEMELSLTGMTDALMFSTVLPGSDMVPDRDLIHMYALDSCFIILEASLEKSDIETVRLLVKVMVALANTALHLRDRTARAALTKTLQIMSSTDLTFFNELSQFRELFMLWKLHRESYRTCCDSIMFQAFADYLNAEFIPNWIYIMEHHTMEFNPYLIQQHATSQAEALGNELQQCENLWKDIAGENEVAENARASLNGMAHEARLVKLKHDAGKFASSVHKLFAHSSRDSVLPSLFSEDRVTSEPVTKEGDSLHHVDSRNRIVRKIDSRENNFRMRIRLMKVPEDYRARNRSCEYLASSLTDAESKESDNKVDRRFRTSTEGSLVDLENSWRSDAGSDYNNFLADAQMRAAIIRSPTNPEYNESAFGGVFDEDDQEGEDIDIYDAKEEDDRPQLPGESQLEDTADKVTAHGHSASVMPSTHVEATAMDHSSAHATPIDIAGEKAKALVASSSSLSGYSLGTSVLTAVTGVADYFQNSVNDAKDAVEYGVDTLYTTKDAVLEEAQALMQEVSLYTQASHALSVDSLRPDILTLEVTASSEFKPAFDKMKESVPSPTARGGQQGHGGTAKRTNAQTVMDLQVNAQLVRHLHIVEGKLILSSFSVRFVAERVIDENESVIVEEKAGMPVIQAWRFLFKRRRWKIDDIVNLYRRRYLLKPTALELFIQSTRKNYFFNLTSDNVVSFHEELMARRPRLLKRDPSVRRLRHPSSLFRNSSMSHRWVRHEISTFEYLMWLNTIAGRTYNDLTQYPVFPWVLSDYESATLDLGRRETYRDLTKPMGALEPTRLKFFVDRFNAFEDPDIPKFMYGTHYSNIGAVLYYLIRLEPFTSYALNIQGGKFDHADRLFHSIAETWRNCLTDYSDLKELTPEWFYLPEFLVNCNELELGTRQNGADVNDVVLPPWARSPEDFVLKNLVALESEYVSANIHLWIDLVFGFKQRGAAAVEANNVFFYLTYEGMVDVNSISDPIAKSSMQSQIAHFGQTPTQVLRDPHPQRRPLGSATAAGDPTHLETPSLPPADRNRAVFNAPHEAPIVLLKVFPGTSLLAFVDNNGMLSSHRFVPRSMEPQHHQYHTPRKSKGSVSSLSSSGVETSDFVELQDRESRKVLGEKRFLSTQLSVSNMVAFLHDGMVICTVGHHDFSARFHSTTDGALLYRLLQHQSVVTSVSTSNLGTVLTLGCTDGTVSVWKVASMNSTLLGALKIFREPNVSSKPVHANDYSADQVLLGHNAQINCVSASDELGVCVSGSASNECFVHDLEDGSILHSYKVPGHFEPGVILLALSNVGHVVLQSMGTGSPMLYSFHLNGTLLAQLMLADQPMTSLSISARYSKIVVSNNARALVMTAQSLDDERVLLDRDDYGDISAQGLAPDEMHVVFGVGSGKIVCLPLLSPQSPPHKDVENTL